VESRSEILLVSRSRWSRRFKARREIEKTPTMIDQKVQ
jgi:hypothetical protein